MALGAFVPLLRLKVEKIDLYHHVDQRQKLKRFDI